MHQTLWNHPRRSLLACALICSVTLLGFYGSRSVVVAEQEPAINHAKALSQAFRKAAEATVPAVVKITTRSKPVETRGGQLRGNPFKGTPFEQYFNDNFEGFDLNPSPRGGVGSGVIIDSKGVILTNNHVVDGADEITVRLHDGREFKTTDFKVDSETDLAVVRLSGVSDLPAARLGDSDKLETGDWVIAVGNPFELETTVSAGIISGKGRSLSKVHRAKFLQTDAAINPGNSGGPLVNLDGEVVGINTAIATNSGGYQGVGFAIPINTAKWVTPQLVDRGSVQRAYLGVAIRELEAAEAEKLGINRGQGVYVREVYPNTPAAAAGLKEGDVILQYSGQVARGPAELQEAVERTPFDSKRPLKILRDGKPLTVDVVVKALPAQAFVSNRNARPLTEGDGVVNSATIGIQVNELTPEVARKLGYNGDGGVVVSQVDANSVAYAAGLREGMIILRVGKKPVASTAEFTAALENESLADGILLLVRTASGNKFLVLQQS